MPPTGSGSLVWLGCAARAVCGSDAGETRHAIRRGDHRLSEEKGRKEKRVRKGGQVHFADAGAGLPRGRTSTLRPMRASILLRQNGGRTGPGVVESDAPSARRRG